MVALPVEPVAPNPNDQLTGYTVAWGLWVLAFAVVEGIALHQERKHDDRRKRTLSANLRAVFATDSVTGVPLDVPFGRVRRFILGVALGPGWLPTHLSREGVV
jgi:hypothetical protein